MKSINYKWFIIIILTALVIVAGIFIFTRRTTPSQKFIDKVGVLRDSINVADGKLATLRLEEVKLEHSLYVQSKQISEQKKIINDLKRRLNEKVDSVAHLDDKHTFEYITKYLSQRDSTQWR